MIVLSVVYPKAAGSRFDHAYYTEKHIPLVKSRWSGMGLERVELFRGTAGLDGGQAPFELIGLLHFSSLEAMQAALVAYGGEITADIPNFTDVGAFLQTNATVPA